MNKRLELNIRYYYLYSATWVMIIGPIMTVFLLAKGLNFSQIMFMSSVCAASTVISEVPSGAIADLYGRKLSLMLSSACFAISMLIFVFGPTMYILLIGEFFAGIGLSFKSGADSSLVYDTLLKLDREKDYVEVQSKGHSFFLGTQIIGSIVAGLLYSVNPVLPFAASAVLMLFSGFFASRMTEVQGYHEDEEKLPYVKQIYESGKFVLNHNKVKAVVLFYVFFFFFYRTAYWLYQPYFQAVHVDVAWFGIIFAGLNIIATVASRLSAKYIEKTKGYSILMLSFFLAISFVLLGISPHWAGVAFIGIQQLSRGFHMPVILKYINKHTPSNKRATVVSFNSLMGNLTYVLLAPLAGVLMDITSVFNVHLLLAGMMAIGIVIFYFYLKKAMTSKS